MLSPRPRLKIADLEKQVQLLTSAFNGPGSQPGAGDVRRSTKNARPSNPQNLESNLALNFRERDPVPIVPLANATGSVNLNSWLDPQPHRSANAPSFNPDPQSFLNTPEDTSSTHSGLRPSAVSSRSIKTVQLNPAQIDNLFQIFFEHYHPSLPFLDPSKSPDEYYNSGEHLFWAIVGLASRRYDEDFMLFAVLSEWVPKLVWSAISTPPYNLPTVHSIILISAWPFPVDSTYKCTSVTLSSIAISTAMQLGLHRPMNATDFLQTKATISERDCRMRTATWAAANILSQSLTSTWGLLPIAPFDKTINFACQTGNMYTVPDDLRFKLILQRYCNRVTQVIYGDLREPQAGNNAGDRPSFALTWESNLNALNYELDEIETQHSHMFSIYDRIYVSAARLYMHSMYFFDSSPTPTRKTGILRAYASASSFTTLITSLDSTRNLFSYMCAYHIRMLLVATCIMLKVLRSSYRHDVDFEAGKKLCTDAMVAASRVAVGSGDSAGKLAKMVAQVWHSGDTGVLEEPPELLVKSRLGASIIYDFIWMWRQEFGGVPEAYPSARPKPSSPPPESTMFQPLDVFQDASFVDLDFLNDPNWMEGLEEPMH
ncbi:Regulatory protein [Lachnellula willkommii]|uniref:Regulatory protein n=1 Tax=Lachnellula willkommii TaxID=215461 RepID=A0A559MDL4_9HELO|nr:Regulatory protein [Lachnellula willkommii]